MAKQVTSITFIFICASVAWFILAGTVESRTRDVGKQSRQAVDHLWGGAQVQHAPHVARLDIVDQTVERTEGERQITETVRGERLTPLPLESSAITATLELDHRKKGLLWYPTYEVAFAGEYTVRNPEPEPIRLRLQYDFPVGANILDDFDLSFGDGRAGASVTDGKIVREVDVEALGEVRFSVAYRSQGVGSWRYDFGRHVEEIRDFRLDLKTDFAAIDFAAGTLSPGTKDRTGDGWHLAWNYNRLMTDAGIGIMMPERLNPGPWVSRVTFFAPVSLFLFFFLIFVIAIIREIPLHPMHYFFLAAAFFAFHLLLAYLVDHISVHLAALIASATSLALVISYMRIVVNTSFAFSEVGIAQLVYLVAFSYTFFLPGYTGLMITILTIVTLFIVMQATARIDWNVAFGGGPANAHPTDWVPDARFGR